MITTYIHCLFTSTVLAVFLCGLHPASGVNLVEMLERAHNGFADEDIRQSRHCQGDVSWLTVAMAGRPYGRASGGVIGDYWYVFGNINEPTAQAYSWYTDHWQMSTEPPFGTCNWCGVSTGEAIYLIGCYGEYSLRHEVQKFTPIGDGPSGVWEIVADYPLAVAGVAAAWDGGDYIYASGGSDLNSVYREAYRYSIESNTWVEIAPLPIPMTYHGGAFINNRFHVMGGVQEPATAHYIYDPETDSWAAGTEMPIPNYFATFSLVQTEDRIVSVGGGGGYYLWPATDAVQVYDPAADSWTQETVLPFVLGLNAAEATPDESIVSSGGFESYQFYPYTFKGTGFPTGNTIIAPETSKSSNIVESFGLLAAYPNPFNSKVTLQFSLSEPSDVSLNIQDVNGRQLVQIAEGMHDTGLSIFTYNAKNLTSGVYIVILEVHGVLYRQKLLLIK